MSPEMSVIETTANAMTYVMENGRQVFPCRCGVTHRGEYAAEDWNHHNCLHDDELVRITEEQVLCGLCGMSWVLSEGKVNE